MGLDKYLGQITDVISGIIRSSNSSQRIIIAIVTPIVIILLGYGIMYSLMDIYPADLEDSWFVWAIIFIIIGVIEWSLFSVTDNLSPIEENSDKLENTLSSDIKTLPLTKDWTMIIFVALILYVIAYKIKSPENVTVGYHIVSFVIPLLSYSLILFLISSLITATLRKPKSFTLILLSWLLLSATAIDLGVSIYTDSADSEGISYDDLGIINYEKLNLDDIEIDRTR